MSATTYGLPTSLTPDVLAQVLRYEPRHWKAIAPRLVREHSDVWEHIQLSDGDFYTKLHTLLKDPLNRRALEVAAQKENTRNRSLTLCGAIHRYYLKSLRNDPSLVDRLPMKPSPIEIIDVLASCDDDDRLANVVWAFAESGKLTHTKLSEIVNDHPGVRMRLAGTVINAEVVAGPLGIQWAACLSRMKGTLERAEKYGPDSKAVELLVGYTNELRELVRESKRSTKIIASLTNLIDEHRDVFSDHSSLIPYVRMMNEGIPLSVFPQNAGDLVEKIGQCLSELVRITSDIRQASLALANADAEQRTQLLAEMNELHRTEINIRDQMKQSFIELFPGIEIDIDSKPPTTQADTTGSSNSGKYEDLNDPAVVKETFEPPIPVDSDGNATNTAQHVPTDEEAVPLQSASSDTDGAAIPLPTDATPPRADCITEGTELLREETTMVPVTTPTKSDHQTGAERKIDQVSPTITHPDNGILELSPRRTTSPKINPISSDSATDDNFRHRNTSLSGAADVLDAMLSSGKFARAYWLAYADHSLGDPILMGALCEGARIGPGDSCPGVLAQFFEALAEKEEWTDDDRLLLCAAVIGPSLFADPLPQGIYQLISQLPVENSPLGTMMQKIRDLCVYQNTKIRPEDLGIEFVDNSHGARLDQLANDAQAFLDRVPHIRFAYAPANRALQFLYRAGSDWHRLHTIIGENRSSRLKEARLLLKNLDPANTVTSLHEEAEIIVLKQPLEGRARGKLIRHLHDTIGLAGEWIRLTDTSIGGHRHTNESRVEELRRSLQVLLPQARESLKSAKGRGSADALDSVLEDVETRIHGMQATNRPSLVGDLLLLPTLPLEDDFEPIDDDLDQLRRAVLDAEHTEPEPRAALKECLKRQEYRRAREIISRCQLGKQLRDDYERAVADKRSNLEIILDDLEVEIEDAFLLGQLREHATERDSGDNSNRNALERSQLLSVVREARAKLNRTDEPEADGLREITRDIDEVSSKIKDMTSERRDLLRREFRHIMDQFPETEQSQTDRDYLDEAFKECFSNNDDVAAFDLLDRGRRAIRNMEQIARASIGSSESLKRFLERTDEYREVLTGRRWLSQIQENIREGNTVAGIPFGQLDNARRDEAISSLKAWHSLTSLRLSSAHDKLERLMDALLRFVGLPLVRGGIDVADTTEDGFAHVRIKLARSIVFSPLPAFGSACSDRYEIIVSQRRMEPQQIAEYIRGRRLSDKSVLVYLLPPESPQYRLRWQRHCIRSRLTALPLDFTLFFHLCGVRNRLPALLEIGLPFTWSCPYITKGENVASEMFVGRSNEADTLMDPMGSCIVFGGRQLGKSALLRHVHRENHDPGTSIYITYLDVDDLGSDSQDHDAMMAVFWRRVYDELHRDGAIPEQPRKVLDRGSRLIEEVPNGIRTRLEENESMRIVLLLDESDDLLDCDSGRDFMLVRRLRALMASTERRFKVVFAGLQSVQRYNSWKNHPFAQLGSELVVNPLSPVAAQDLIIRPLRALGFAFERAGLILRILSQTNYHPGLIQIICYRLLENLYEKLLWRDQDGPIRQITNDDILAVERDTAVMEDIRNRFDWTLDLDDRYKVLTYALVLTPDPSAPHLESEFMSIGGSWWPAVFETMDAQSLRAVLDEMVGLGVLLREHEDDSGRRQYRLRSPNLLRLLGPQEAIEAELERIISRDHVSRSNPRNFHPIVDRKSIIFGPLTNEQQGQISVHSRPFHLSIISGSEALGLGQVERQFDWLLSRNRNDGDQVSSNDSKSRSSVSIDHDHWKKIKLNERMQEDVFIKELQNVFRPRRRNHRYAVVRLREIKFTGTLSALFDRFVGALGQFCTNESKGHLIVLLNPYETWLWLGDRYRERVLAQSRVTGLVLRRWSDGAIANAFDQIGARTGSKFAADEVFSKTSGFHWLVDEGLRRTRSRQEANAENLIQIWDELRSEVLSEDDIEAALAALGLHGSDETLEKHVLEILRLTEPRDGTSVLVETSYVLAAEMLGGESREFLEENIVRIKEWMRAMDFARPGSVASDDGSMLVAAWVRDVLTATGA